MLMTKPLGLTDCVASALEFNDRIAAKRAAIQIVGGDELIIHSRFLPHLYLDLTQEIDASSAGAMGMQYLFRLSQTLLEFGKDNPEVVFLRQLIIMLQNLCV